MGAPCRGPPCPMAQRRSLSSATPREHTSWPSATGHRSSRTSRWPEASAYATLGTPAARRFVSRWAGRQRLQVYHSPLGQPAEAWRARRGTGRGGWRRSGTGRTHRSSRTRADRLGTTADESGADGTDILFNSKLSVANSGGWGQVQQQTANDAKTEVDTGRSP